MFWQSPDPGPAFTLVPLALASPLLPWSTSTAVATPLAEAVRPGTMTVTGSATLQVSPDCVDLTMMRLSMARCSR